MKYENGKTTMDECELCGHVTGFAVRPDGAGLTEPNLTKTISNAVCQNHFDLSLDVLPRPELCGRRCGSGYLQDERFGELFIHGRATYFDQITLDIPIEKKADVMDGIFSLCKAHAHQFQQLQKGRRGVYVYFV